MSKKIPIHPSSGNVFADLGLPDADERLAKAQMAHQIIMIIESRKLTQKAAAQLLGLDQPKVSALMRGKLSGFSTDRLFRLLNKLDKDVEIIIRPKGRNQEHGIVRVSTT